LGDCVVWRKDDVPAYELAAVADDVALGLTEVVRGEDLRLPTARLLLVYRALGAMPRGLTPDEVLALARAGTSSPSGAYSG
jgi:glutamyl-tRNA synthetase